MSRDLIALVAAFALLVALIALGPGSNQSAPGGGPSSHASSPGGALALHRWLEALDYEVERLQYVAFAPDPAAAMLIVLEPSERYSREEAEAVRAWVEGGGTLLLADGRPGLGAPAALLLEAFDLAVALSPDPIAGDFAPVLQPALGAPVARRLALNSVTIVASERSDLAPLAGSVEAPALAGLQYGAGYVFVSAAAHPFTNEGLRDDDNAAMVLNLLRRVPPGGRVVFDEVHHGFVGEASMRSLLLGTPWGWATLYGGAVLVGYLIITARRFGRPVPLQAEAARRSSAEYLASMAGLLRRAGKGAYVQEHFRSGFKRRLARANGLSPDLDDRDLVAAIAQTRPTDARAIAELLGRMGRPAADDQALLELVRDADRLLEP